ncbi:PPR domain-containing protein/PPR_3 domain-containing protein [Cephalotus follicularis]|uniref:PPR domain-containing protein/PPR_3 domain-containing protein n=1 Tax=Cephalotus follicularis TaxID=3775 RepID=A0A1Q3CXK7_CEPFO|nr:PPR domain-containing protein/PPR_3 domain-containing protein [Cephalotus follicularis]
MLCVAPQVKVKVSHTPNLNQCVLAIIEKCNHLNHLKQLQCFLITIGHAHTQFYAFKLVRFCTLKLNDLYYARFIFDHLRSPNVFLYTAMLTAYASQPPLASAFALYRHMLRGGKPKPNQFIYPHVLRCNGTKLVHTQILKSGFAQYPVVQTALVDSYARISADLKNARELFDEMADRNVVSWTAMISGYARLGDIGNALLLFEEMPERDVPSWNAVIAGCTQNGLFSEAISLFRRMIAVMEREKHRQNRPNQVTVVCALSACGHTGMLHSGKSIHTYVYRNGLGYDSFVSNALVDMYGKCGSLKEARRVFEMTSMKSLTAWNSMINCFALHGQGARAITVFEEMMQCGDGHVMPDGVTFIGLLNACTHGGLLEKGRAYFELMTRNYGIEPRIEHYGCLIDLLGRAGQFEEALEVVRTMNIPPDEVVWGSLLNGCRIHGHTDLAEFAVKRLIEIDPKNGGYGIMLANLYGELEKWDEARKVRKLLKERNAYKTPGCSWVEIDNQVHQFYSVDRTHPRTEEIYMMLDSLISLD